MSVAYLRWERCFPPLLCRAWDELGILGIYFCRKFFHMYFTGSFFIKFISIGLIYMLLRGSEHPLSPFVFGSLLFLFATAGRNPAVINNMGWRCLLGPADATSCTR